MYLTDEQFHIIKPLLPTPRGNVEISHREIMEALLYLLIEGCRWRALPRRFGKWYTVYRRVHRWAESGVLSQVMEALRERNVLPREASIAALDSTVVKVHKHAAGAPKKRGSQKIGRSRGGLTCKIHAIGPSESQALCYELSSGNCHDAPQGPSAVDQASATVAVLADGQGLRRRPYAPAGSGLGM